MNGEISQRLLNRSLTTNYLQAVRKFSEHAGIG